MGRFREWAAALISIGVIALGPAAYGQNVSWQSISGPTGGDVDAMATGPEGTIYATASTGLYETRDDPVSWKYLSSPGYCECLAVSHSGTIYASANTVAKSTDGGRTWHHSAGIFSHSVVIGPGGYIYAGSSDGVVYVSSDEGDTWTKTVTGMSENPDSRIYGLAVDSGGVVYAGGSGIFKSTDRGKTWQNLNGPIIVEQIAVAEEKSGSSFKERIIAANGQMVYTSDDTGNSWKSVEFSPNTIRSLTADSAGNVCAVFDGGSFYSSDFGNDWQSIKSGSMDFIDVSATISPDGYLYAGSVDGVYRLKLSSPGSGWKKVSAGLTAEGVVQLAFTNSADDSPACTFAIGQWSGHIFRMKNESGDWVQCDQGTRGWIHSITVAPDNYVFAGTDYGVFVSSDSGETWNEQGTTIQSVIVSSVAACPNGDILAGSESPGGIFKSADDGLTWHKSVAGLSNQLIASIYAAAGGELFAWGGNLPREPSGGLFRSGIEGNSWQQIGLPAANDVVISMIETPEGYLFFTDGARVYRAAGENRSWTDVTPGDSSFYPQSLAANSYGDILVGGSNRVYLTEDYARTWWPILNMDSGTRASCVAFDGANYAYVGTQQLVYRSVSPIEEKVITAPLASLVRQNYPNPFNPTTTISYQLSMKSRVTLKVYDVLGREVATLVDGQQNAGAYKVKFNASRLASGIYFYRFETGAHREVRKMLLLK